MAALRRVNGGIEKGQSMGALKRFNGGIEKGQWGSWSEFIVNALIHLF